MTEVRGPLLVVALDDSEPARVAFRWAVRRAARTGGRVRAVRAIEGDGIALDVAGCRWTIDDDLLRGVELAALRREAAGIAAELGAPEPEVSVDWRRGSFVDVLLATSADADGLVVGERDHAVRGRRVRALLVRSRCPVSVVRPPARHRSSEHRTAGGGPDPHVPAPLAPGAP